MDFVNHPLRFFCVGRLGKDFDGLILLTNEGDIVNRILCFENRNEKEYQVTVGRTVPKSFFKKYVTGYPNSGYSCTSLCSGKNLSL